MGSVIERASMWEFVGDRNQNDSVGTYKLGKKSEKSERLIEEASSWGEADLEAKAGPSSPKIHNVMESIKCRGTYQVGEEERIVNNVAVDAVSGTGVRAGSLRKFHLCEVEDCGAKFSTKLYLKRHIEIFHEEKEEKEIRSRQRPKLLHITNQPLVLSPNLNKTLNNKGKGRAVSRKKVPALFKDQSPQELASRYTSPRTNRILALQSFKKVEIEYKSKLINNWQNGHWWY